LKAVLRYHTTRHQVITTLFSPTSGHTVSLTQAVDALKQLSEDKLTSDAYPGVLLSSLRKCPRCDKYIPV
jgi:hypothetical protein